MRLSHHLFTNCRQAQDLPPTVKFIVILYINKNVVKTYFIEIIFFATIRFETSHFSLWLRKA